MPQNCEAVLIIDKREKVHLDRVPAFDEGNFSAYRLEPGKKYNLTLDHT